MFVGRAEGLGPVGLDEARDGLVHVVEALREPLELCWIQPAEDLLEHVAPQDFELVELGLAGLREADQHDPTVFVDADALDEAAVGHPVDESGRVGEGDVEQVGDAAHRGLAVARQEAHHVEMGHADPGLHGRPVPAHRSSRIATWNSSMMRSTSSWPSGGAQPGRGLPSGAVRVLSMVRIT